MTKKKVDKPIVKKKKSDGDGLESAKASKFELSQIRLFIDEVKAEFGKIAWPDKKHTIGSTVVVTIFVIMISFYLGAVDLIVGKIVGSVLR